MLLSADSCRLHENERSVQSSLSEHDICLPRMQTFLGVGHALLEPIRTSAWEANMACERS